MAGQRRAGLVASGPPPAGESRLWPRLALKAFSSAPPPCAALSAPEPPQTPQGLASVPPVGLGGGATSEGGFLASQHLPELPQLFASDSHGGD